MGRGPFAVALGLILALLLTGCGSAAARGGPTVSAGSRIYVSLGDSVAAGYQPDGHGGGSTTTDGFAYQVAADQEARGRGVVLENFACSGVTSTQLVSQNGCEPAALGPGAPTYPSASQAAAALELIQQHQGAVSLVTVVIGGNDLLPCLTTDDPPGCLAKAVPVLRGNLDGLLTRLRATLGSRVPIVGLTYADPYLGQWVRDRTNGPATARASVELFRSYLNPALAQVYAAHGASFVDVTQLTGGYEPFTESERLPPYGTIPRPVAQACRLTWYCSDGDVHPTREGHALIAAAVLKELG